MKKSMALRAVLLAPLLTSTASALGGCRVLGLDSSVPCESDANCDDGSVCIDDFCVAGSAGEGEGDVVGEGEGDVVGEGEGDVVVGEGEGDIVVGEGEGDVVVGEGEGDIVAGEGEGEGEVVGVELLRFVGAGFDLGELDDLDGNAPIGVLRGSDTTCFDCEFQPVAGLPPAFALDDEVPVVGTTDNLNRNGVVLELVFRSPATGEGQLIDLTDNSDGWSADVSGGAVRVTAGQHRCSIPVNPGVWHQVLCAGNDDGARCAVDGATQTCPAGGNGGNAGTNDPIDMVVGADATADGIALAVARVWNVPVNANLTGRLATLSQERLFAALGIIGPQARATDDGAPKLVLVDGVLFQQASRWPRVPAVDGTRGILFEPATLNLFDAGQNAGFDCSEARAGVDACFFDVTEVGAPDGSRGGTFSFFVFDGEVIVTDGDGALVDCANHEGFVVCAMPSSNLHLAGPATIGAIQIESDVFTTAVVGGSPRVPDRVDVPIGFGHESVALVFERHGIDDCELGGVGLISGLPSLTACQAHSDCPANDVCDGNRCRTVARAKTFALRGGRLSVDGNAVGDALDAGPVTVVFRTLLGAGCDPADTNCREVTSVGAPGRLELGATGARVDGAGAALVRSLVAH